jgi:hypothetical protein
MRAGGSSGRDQASSPADVFDSRVLSPSRHSCQCAEYTSRILDLESRLSLVKCQAQMAMDKASKSCGFMKQISILEDKVSGLMAKIFHLEECDSFLIGIVESVCEMLRCAIPCGFSCFLLFHYFRLKSFVVLATCLDFAAEARRVAERNAALEKASEGIDSLWSDPRRRRAIVLLQDHARILERQLMVVEDL